MIHGLVVTGPARWRIRSISCFCRGVPGPPLPRLINQPCACILPAESERHGVRRWTSGYNPAGRGRPRPALALRDGPRWLQHKEGHRCRGPRSVSWAADRGAHWRRVIREASI